VSLRGYAFKASRNDEGFLIFCHPVAMKMAATRILSAKWRVKLSPGSGHSGRRRGRFGGRFTLGL